jgi:UDP-glucose 4-epimerase
MPSVLVTGAAGFVGQHLARALAERGFLVGGLDRSVPPEPIRRLFSEFALADLLVDEPELSNRYSHVVHLAGLLPGTGNRGQLFAVNVGGTSAVLDRYVSEGMHLVLLSTGLVYGPRDEPCRETMACHPRDAYGESKLAAELVARVGSESKAAKLTVARPSVVYGPGASRTMLLAAMISALRAGEPFAMTAGEQRRDFLHIDDLTSAIVAMVSRGSTGIFNLAAGESVRIRDVAEMVGEISGHRDLLMLGKLPYRNGEVFDYSLDTTAAQSKLGWRPRVRLQEGLAAIWRDAP